MLIPQPAFQALAARAQIIMDLRALLQPIGVDASAALILAFVGEGKVPQSQIEKCGLFIGSNVPLCLLRLRSKGYIASAEDAFDKRRKVVRCTPAGLALARDIERRLVGCSVRVS